MKQQFPNLFTPATIGNLRVKNRIVKSPQTTGLSNLDGSVTQRLVRHYTDLAKGGTGLVIVEYAYVDEIASKSCHCQLGITSHEHIAGLGWLADSIKNNGARAGIQIEHCGRQRFLGPPMKSASRQPWPMLYEQFGYVPEELTIEEIQKLVTDFGDAARRAKDAGFDLVEIHGAHGYLITNFLSPHSNHRADWYGGSRENRFRFLSQIVADCRKKVGPDYPLSVRLSGSDYEPEGMTIEDTIYYAQELEKLGVDVLHISGGDHHTMIHQVTPMQLPVCYNTWAAEAVKKAVNIPVIASGSITLPKYAEDIISSGKADFVGLARPLWADAEWTKKALEDRPEDIRPCIRCNEGCLQRSSFLGRTLMCAVNPILGFEDELAIKPATDRKRVAVVGGGPAGMEAARVCALRGHEVTLYEKRQLGGYLLESSRAEFKADIRELTAYMVAQIGKLGVTVVEREATAADIVAGNFDACLVATGARPIMPPISGNARDKMIGALDVLNGAPVGKQVVVLGGGMIGVETAVELAIQGHQVTIVEMLDDIMNDCAITDVIAYWGMIYENNVRVLTRWRLDEVNQDGAVISDRRGRRQNIPCDNVVVAAGLRSDHTLFEELNEAGLEAVEIGDGEQVGKIMDAIHNGYKAALRI